ncbi:zinc finger, C3HC4 type (RING finger) protein (macronuclear) [Tetrahymena thermophila SB210]|uniref:Zinc finger, C3HC4 type (RING finger) protein n=1 Tax=Tetrahymena thermophila (strain SB210) TaxID=312017 RepID=Q24BZ2_TETTS|nr:zinc finger, C3HC4 type (RING finger) protein [Tetrahymena thermophila SB210]EAS05310.1 zinc finger, C3HC4 type (RING finger) protein [Tetrahymena thermophila SB210]|eukprot:XP_001025555.1 zinc finger, C3HC4 type (RING finger) protein [Tetrahymena thermophila SB210]
MGSYNKIITIYYFITYALLMQLGYGDSGNPSLTLQDNDSIQQIQCQTSISQPCLVTFTPSSDFHGAVELNFQTIAESLGTSTSTYSQQIQLQYCMNNSSVCDFGAFQMGLRSQSIQGVFSQNTQYTFILQAQSNDPLNLVFNFSISKGQRCISNNCSGNGACIVSNKVKQCSCNQGYGAKNCQAQVQTIAPNVFLDINVSGSSQKIIQFTSSNPIQQALLNNQYNLIIQNQNNQRFNIYILDGNSQTSSGIFSQEYSSNSNDSLNLNQIFSSSNTLQNFLLILIINNESNISQSIKVQLQIQQSSQNQSSSDSYFIYFLIGMVGLIMLIIILGFIYFLFKRRLIRERAQNNIQILAQALICPSESKETDNSEKFMKLYNQAIPSHKMQASTLENLIKQNKEKHDSNNKGDAQLPYQSEGGNSNQIICSICLQAIQENDKYRETICKHLFHQECLDVWIQKQRNCPMCRSNHKIIDLQKYLKENKRCSITETHQINGHGVVFEMQENTSPNQRNSSSPFGFIPILPFSLTRQQQSGSVCQNMQELASPKKASYSPPKPIRPSFQLQQQQMNDSSNVQITIPDNTNDLTNLQLPQASLNESSINQFTLNNQLLNNSLAGKKSKDEEQNNTLTKLIDILNNNSSILNYISKNPQNNNNNNQQQLKPIAEEEQQHNSAYSSYIRQSNYNIFTDNNQARQETDLERGKVGTQNTIQQEMTSQATENYYHRQSIASSKKLNYNFQIQPQVQAQFMKAQIFTSQLNNSNLYKNRVIL